MAKTHKLKTANDPKMDGNAAREIILMEMVEREKMARQELEILISEICKKHNVAINPRMIVTPRGTGFDFEVRAL